MKAQHHMTVKDHSIHLITAEMGEAGGPVYNHIIFRNSKGQDAMALHAMPMIRQDNTRSLRAVMAPAGAPLPIEHFMVLRNTILFRGTGEEYLRKLMCAGDAMKFINTQNLNYNPSDENGHSPNSVAHTLIYAMGLEFPQDCTQFWAPGHERLLVPHQWRSAYAN